MSVFRNENEKRMRIVDWIRAGYAKPEERMVGPELEHFVVDQNGERVFYPGEKGVEGVLEQLKTKHPTWEEVRAEGHLIGLFGEGVDISLEPGAQFELSIPASASILTLKERYQRALDLVYEVLDPMGYALVMVGLDPKNKPEEIPIIPKGRYHAMDAYMGKRGEGSRTMMRKSCALQISLDIEGDLDFRRKYQILGAMTPILYTLFDATVDNNGARIPHFNHRQEVWRTTDPQRTGLPPRTFDETFSLMDYANWVLSVPPIFLPTEEGDVETQDAPLTTLLEGAETLEEADRMIRHGMSIVFPDIRVKQILEVRVMDSVKPAYAFGAAALLKGLFYNEEAMETLARWLLPMQMDWVERGKNAGRDHGIQGYFHGDYFVNWGRKMIKLARQGLPEEERALLDPLETLWNNLDTPRLETERIVDREGWTAALRALEVRHV